ncbi:Heparinase II/III [Mariniradius saccharolyticus AK6]|uniref:Heparinase II/III n=2 Tax=Mariniradius TaxID=1245590 RepID=M7Y592_9BACT|nr:Heparinase II/III [Mariniradius saccharolyticus AK6]
MEVISKIGLYTRTISHLKMKQVAYQFKYRFVKPRNLKKHSGGNFSVTRLKFQEIPVQYEILAVSDTHLKFNFLNLQKEFEGAVDWNFQGFGKLWNYNLQYLDFLKQQSVSFEIKAKLLAEVYNNLWDGRLRLEPYPVSLRIMNVIRFFSTQEIIRPDDEVFVMVFAEAKYLSKNLEFHILANHLLENLFALLMAGHFFGNEDWIKKAERFLEIELEEQILRDGAHFELSPMYHQIILFRILEAIGYLSESSQVRGLLQQKAILMLSWLNEVSFSNGEVPHFNDSTYGVSLNTTQLNQLASLQALPINKNIHLKESGYRKFKNSRMELVIDVNGISPGYQPGHAHADTFSFVLYILDFPIIVDAGVSTYNISSRRDLERSTMLHNTVSINGGNSSEVWAGFRVGRRAIVTIHEDSDQGIFASHSGYRNLGIEVFRRLKISNGRIEIEDLLVGDLSLVKPQLNFHFHPSISIRDVGENTFSIGKDILMEFDSKLSVAIQEYDYCLGFNKLAKAKKINVVGFKEDVKTTIKIN